MMHRHVTHPAGTFAICSGCRREPKHIIIVGTSTAERRDIRTAAPGERHMLECCRCGRTTARSPTLEAAVSEWGAVYAQAALPLRAVPHKRRAAA